jgi:hypothetical protein
VSRTVVDNPEDAASIIGGPCHDLLDQSVKRLNAILLLAATKDPGMVNIQTGNIGPGLRNENTRARLASCRGVGRREWGVCGAVAWMRVFSSAEITNSSSSKGLPSHCRAYRSSAAGLVSKVGLAASPSYHRIAPEAIRNVLDCPRCQRHHCPALLLLQWEVRGLLGGASGCLMNPSLAHF